MDKKFMSRCAAALLVILTLALVGISLSGCQIVGPGCQISAAGDGVTEELILPEDMKLVDVEWNRYDTLWYLVRPMHPEDQAERYIFEDKYGGQTIIIREAKTE